MTRIPCGPVPPSPHNSGSARRPSRGTPLHGCAKSLKSGPLDADTPLMHRLAVLTSAAVVVLMGALPMTASAAGISRRVPSILSAAWGTDNGVGCPTGQQGLDNIPVIFDWFIRRASIQATDFQVLRSDDTVATPTCALQFPAYAPDEAQTVNLIGDFGESVTGPTPIAVRVVGALQGNPLGGHRWRPLPPVPQVSVSPLTGGPYIVDAWAVPPVVYDADPDRCKVGQTFVHVVWSNGLTAYPTGAKIGRAVTASYRAIYRLRNGNTIAVAPLAVAFHYHAKVANEDNNHDLCLPRLPRGARLMGVSIGGELMEDPHGDANVPQNFRLPRPEGLAR